MGDKRKRPASPGAGGSGSAASGSTTAAKRSRMLAAPSGPEPKIEIVWELVGSDRSYSRYIDDKRIDEVVPAVASSLGASVLGINLMHVRQGGYEAPVWDDHDFQAIKARALATGSRREVVRVYSAAIGQRPSPVPTSVPMPPLAPAPAQLAAPSPPETVMVAPTPVPAPVSALPAPTPRSALKSAANARTPRSQKRVALDVPSPSPPTSLAPPPAGAASASPARDALAQPEKKLQRNAQRKKKQRKSKDVPADSATASAAARATPAQNPAGTPNTNPRDPPLLATPSPAGPSAPRPLILPGVQQYKPSRPSPLSQSAADDEERPKKKRASEAAAGALESPSDPNAVPSVQPPPQAIPLPADAPAASNTGEGTANAPGLTEPNLEAQSSGPRRGRSAAQLGAVDGQAAPADQPLPESAVQPKAKAKAKGKGKGKTKSALLPVVRSQAELKAQMERRRAFAAAMAAKIAADVVGNASGTEAPAAAAKSAPAKDGPDPQLGPITNHLSDAQARVSAAESALPAPLGSTPASRPAAEAGAPTAGPQKGKQVAVVKGPAAPASAKVNGAKAGPRRSNGRVAESEDGSEADELEDDYESEEGAAVPASALQPVAASCLLCDEPIAHPAKDCPTVKSGVDALQARLQARRAQLKRLAAEEKGNRKADVFDEAHDPACQQLVQWIKRQTVVAAHVANGTPTKTPTKASAAERAHIVAKSPAVKIVSPAKVAEQTPAVLAAKQTPTAEKSTAKNSTAELEDANEELAPPEAFASQSQPGSGSSTPSDTPMPSRSAMPFLTPSNDTPFPPAHLLQKALNRNRRPGSMSGLSVSDAVIETNDSSDSSDDSDADSSSDSESDSDSDSSSSSSGDSQIDPADLMRRIMVEKPLSKRDAKKARMSAASMQLIDDAESESASDIEESEDEAPALRPIHHRRDSGSSIGDFEDEATAVMDPLEVESDPEETERAKLLDAVADATQDSALPAEHEEIEEEDEDKDEDEDEDKESEDEEAVNSDSENDDSDNHDKVEGGSDSATGGATNDADGDVFMDHQDETEEVSYAEEDGKNRDGAMDTDLPNAIEEPKEESEAVMEDAEDAEDEDVEPADDAEESSAEPDDVAVPVENAGEASNADVGKTSEEEDADDDADDLVADAEEDKQEPKEEPTDEPEDQPTNEHADVPIEVDELGEDAEDEHVDELEDESSNGADDTEPAALDARFATQELTTPIASRVMGAPRSSGRRSLNGLVPSSPPLGALEGDIALREAIAEDADVLSASDDGDIGIPIGEDLPATQVDVVASQSLPPSQAIQHEPEPEREQEPEPKHEPETEPEAEEEDELPDTPVPGVKRLRGRPPTTEAGKAAAARRAAAALASASQPASQQSPSKSMSQPQEEALPPRRSGRVSSRPSSITASSSQPVPAAQPERRVTRASSREPPVSQPLPVTRRRRTSTSTVAPSSPERVMVAPPIQEEDDDEEVTPRANKKDAVPTSPLASRRKLQAERSVTFPDSLPPSSFPAPPSQLATPAAPSSPLTRRPSLAKHESPLFMSGGSLQQTQAYNANPPPLVPETQVEPSSDVRVSRTGRSLRARPSVSDSVINGSGPSSQQTALRRSTRRGASRNTVTESEDESAVEDGATNKSESEAAASDDETATTASRLYPTIPTSLAPRPSQVPTPSSFPTLGSLSKDLLRGGNKVLSAITGGRASFGGANALGAPSSQVLRVEGESSDGDSDGDDSSDDEPAPTASKGLANRFAGSKRRQSKATRSSMGSHAGW